MTCENNWVLEEMSIDELWKAWEEHKARFKTAKDSKTRGQAVMSIVMVENELIKRGVI